MKPVEMPRPFLALNFAQFGVRAGSSAQGDRFLVRSEVPQSGSHGRLQTFRSPRDDVHHSAYGVRSVLRGAGAAQHFHLLNRIQRYGYIHVVMPRLRVVEPYSI